MRKRRRREEAILLGRTVATAVWDGKNLTKLFEEKGEGSGERIDPDELIGAPPELLEQTHASTVPQFEAGEVDAVEQEMKAMAGDQTPPWAS